jgi:hypothetical protein
MFPAHSAIINYLHMLYVYNIHNSNRLITDLQNMESNENNVSMYTNIPKLYTVIIITNVLKGNSEIDGTSINKNSIQNTEHNTILTNR